MTEDIINKCKKDKIDLDVDYNTLTKDNVSKAHAAGLMVNRWTVNTLEDSETVISYGVDYITSN